MTAPTPDDGQQPSWWIYRGDDTPHDDIATRLPPPPPWRDFTHRDDRHLGRHRHLATSYRPRAEDIDLVNAALYLRRPLLVTGIPGIGKSTLAHSIANELRLGPVLRWSITSRSSLPEGLYQYDAIGRLHEVSLRRGGITDASTADPEDIGRFVRLGPLGTALAAADRPRVLLIDEIDKSDVDLPNDLLHVFEEGEFLIPELQRLYRKEPVGVLPADGDERILVELGRVRCAHFPVVIMTSNDEREFPPAFLRRCIQLCVQPPDTNEQARSIVRAHLGQLGDAFDDEVAARITEFVAGWRANERRATDQLLNALYLISAGAGVPDEQRRAAVDQVKQPPSSPRR